MRKILTIAMAAVLAFGAFAMSGCGDKTFKGNYKTEATAEEVRTALTGSTSAVRRNKAADSKWISS